jgi:predicted Zn-dependent protease
VLLPFNRAQEAEADLIGLDLLSRAGFEPRESITLWRRMAAGDRATPPEFLSTHPSSERRISEISARMGSYEAKSLQARASGMDPDCD